MNPIVYFEIGGTDLDRSAAFYRSLFGWTIPDGPMKSITGAGFPGHLNALGHEPSNYTVVYVGVDDIRSYLARAGQLGAKTLVGPVAIPGRSVRVAARSDRDHGRSVAGRLAGAGHCRQGHRMGRTETQRQRPYRRPRSLLRCSHCAAAPQDLGLQQSRLTDIGTRPGPPGTPSRDLGRVIGEALGLTQASGPEGDAARRHQRAPRNRALAVRERTRNRVQDRRDRLGRLLGESAR